MLLCFSDDLNISDGLKNALKNVKKEGNSSLAIANALFIQDTYPPLQSFQDTLVDEFSSEIIEIDFQDVENATTDINEWVNTKTDGAINEIISDQTTLSSTNLLLANALHFKGFWANRVRTIKAKLNST